MKVIVKKTDNPHRGSNFDDFLAEEGSLEKSTARAVEATAYLQRRSVEQGTDRLSPEELEAEIKAVRCGNDDRGV
ncbi:hypothetical protein [Desulfurivibrio dismutans]|uniref:hypothetical protein n=1 Tax=Desulfurivibrio dismutans TaxID=1398908 RepID=UPI0023D97AF0|nr:hypothetical protein [Desulfurivibrio alkaliphilus]MDF1614835.1 hypothetical protein [Desulfurivibrio alkaliphilus]